MRNLRPEQISHLPTVILDGAGCLAAGPDSYPSPHVPPHMGETTFGARKAHMAASQRDTQPSRQLPIRHYGAPTVYSLPIFLNVWNNSLSYPCISDCFAESQINSQICVVDLHHFEELEVTWKMDFFSCLRQDKE